jgi:hypothetical protein
VLLILGTEFRKLSMKASGEGVKELDIVWSEERRGHHQ